MSAFAEKVAKWEQSEFWPSMPITHRLSTYIEAQKEPISTGVWMIHRAVFGGLMAYAPFEIKELSELYLAEGLPQLEKEFLANSLRSRFRKIG